MEMVPKLYSCLCINNFLTSGSNNKVRRDFEENTLTSLARRAQIASEATSTWIVCTLILVAKFLPVLIEKYAIKGKENTFRVSIEF